MSDSAPSKRRRTRGSFTMKTRKRGLQLEEPYRFSPHSDPAPQLTPAKPVSWPENQLPVEIFTLIISHLPRTTIQNMRLVNKEFEEKVSEYLFRVVVVPFKPEIYGIAPESARTGFGEPRSIDLQGRAIMLQDQGMKVFEGFGRRIHKFAMSFEFDEANLARPPVKCDQEAITSFWGIYRWPYKKYNRYAQLEGLEQTADETRTMAKALRFIESAKELGLSIDGGLGWLSGPDVNLKVLERDGKVCVFGESRFAPEPKPKYGRGAMPADPPSSTGDHKQSLYSSLERMLQEAGYHGKYLEPSVRMMLETEESTEQPPCQSSSDLYPGSLSWDGLTNSTMVDVGESNIILNFSNGDDERESHATLTRVLKAKTETHSLKPNDLTNAQREMLLEIEWAQRAFMQSYAIAIIDNPLTFKNIEALTIARLPNRHLPILRRKDFWDSLPQLQKLSIAIIPDWRDVVKLPTSWVQDVKVPPSQSVSGVYQILQEQIAHRENVKILHVEWLCGGEDAPGIFARNQQILAAPIVPNAMDMVNRTRLPQLLVLPFVEHLSLKNCWITPHILARFGLSCKKNALQSLTLNSVSLTAPLGLNAQPNPVHGNTAHAVNAQQLVNNAVANNMLAQFNVIGGVVQNAPAPAPQGGNGTPEIGADWLRPPRMGSWAHMIETLTPGQTLESLRRNEDWSSEQSRRNPSQLTKLEFKSCGYVRLTLDFDQTMLDPPEGITPQSPTMAKKFRELQSYMMKSDDYALGFIVNHIDLLEARTLENAWNMTVGLTASRAVWAAECEEDGVLYPGRGRFEGVIEVPKQPLLSIWDPMSTEYDL